MLPAQPIERLARGFRATGLYIGQPALNPLDGLHSVEQRLVGFGILHDKLRLPIDGQDEGMTSLPKTIEQLDGVPLEVTERSNVVGKIKHEGPHHIRIEYDDYTVSMAPFDFRLANRRLQPLGHLTLRLASLARGEPHFSFAALALRARQIEPLSPIVHAMSSQIAFQGT
jgi:hypothetical protein